MATPSRGPDKRRVFHSDTPTTRAIREVASDELRTEGILRQFERQERQSRHKRNIFWLIVVGVIVLVTYILFT